MNPSPLQLEHYLVTAFSFAANREFDDDQNAGNPQAADLRFEVNPLRHEDHPNRWMFELVVELPDQKEKNQPYSFRIEMVGFFAVTDSYPKEKAELLANVNGPALLFSAAREIVATMTGRGPYPALFLPSVMFVPLAAKEPATPQAKTTSRKKSQKKQSKGRNSL